MRLSPRIRLHLAALLFVLAPPVVQAAPASQLDMVGGDIAVQNFGDFGLDVPVPGVENPLAPFIGDVIAHAGADVTAGFGAADVSAAHPFDRSLVGGDSETIQLDTAAVPEPQTVVLTALGLVGLAFHGRRRRLQT